MILKGFQQCYLDIIEIVSNNFFSIQFTYLCYLDIIEICTVFSIQFNIFVLHFVILSLGTFVRAGEIIMLVIISFDDSKRLSFIQNSEIGPFIPAERNNYQHQEKWKLKLFLNLLLFKSLILCASHYPIIWKSLKILENMYLL